MEILDLTNTLTATTVRLGIEQALDRYIIPLEKLNREVKDIYNFPLSSKALDFSCSPEFLQLLLSHKIDIRRSRGSNVKKLVFESNGVCLVDSFIAELYRYFTFVKQTGCFLYPFAGRMGWHTNSDGKVDGVLRLYAVYNSTNDSVFSYLDKNSGAIRSIKEPMGWSAKLFSIEDQFWHCVKSNSVRLSLGFQLGGLR